MDRYDFSDIRGQDEAVRTVASAVRQRAPILLSGPPGTGKTMIARRIPSLFGPLGEHEQTWLRAEYEGAGFPRLKDPVLPPFRAPHHTISAAAMGSGRCYRPIEPPEPRCRCKQLVSETCKWHELPKAPVPRVGEARLARFGVLFLDEVHEFTRGTIGHAVEALREMGATAPYLVASATPCPCGWRGFPMRECVCTAGSVSRHLDRVQWACAQLRILLRVDVAPISLDDLRKIPPGISSADLRNLTHEGV